MESIAPFLSRVGIFRATLQAPKIDCVDLLRWVEDAQQHLRRCSADGKVRLQLDGHDQHPALLSVEHEAVKCLKEIAALKLSPVTRHKCDPLELELFDKDEQVFFEDQLEFDSKSNGLLTTGSGPAEDDNEENLFPLCNDASDLYSQAIQEMMLENSLFDAYRRRHAW